MSEIPDSPSACPICQRVDAKIRTLPMLQGKLSENEIEQLIKDVQNAVLKKSDNSRGIKMSEDTIVLKKANFDELYEAQKYILLLVEKMAKKESNQDAIIAALGAQVFDLMEKADATGLDVEGSGDEEGGEEKNDVVLPGEGAAPAAPAPAAPAAPIAPAPAAPAPVAPPMPAPSPCDPNAMAAAAPIAPAPAPVAPAPPAPPMGKAQYDAGYNAAVADQTRINGVPVGNFEYPAYSAPRLITEQESRMITAAEKESFGDLQAIGKTSTEELNAKLRAMGVIPTQKKR